jgi:hypothetical protein
VSEWVRGVCSCGVSEQLCTQVWRGQACQGEARKAGAAQTVLWPWLGFWLRLIVGKVALLLWLDACHSVIVVVFFVVLCGGSVCWRAVPCLAAAVMTSQGSVTAPSRGQA